MEQEKAVKRVRKAPAKKTTQEKDLAKALIEKAAEVEALRLAARTGTGTSVVVENCGYVNMVFKVDADKSIVLLAHGPKKTAAIPMHVFEQYKREVDWFEKGYVRVMGEPIENSNIILEPEDWVAQVREEDVNFAVNSFKSVAPINRLWFYLVQREERSGKELMIMRALQKKHEELTGAVLIEDPA